MKLFHLISKPASWLGRNWFKIAVLVLMFFFAGFGLLMVQDNIDRQRELELQKYEDQKAQEEKSYINERKSECYELYEKERAKWNNVKDQE